LRKVEDKMGEGNKQKTFYVEKDKINNVVAYFNKIGNIYNAFIDLQNKGRAKIQPYDGKIEIMCDCQPEILNELEKIIEND